LTVRVPAGLVACAIAASLAACEAHVVVVPPPRLDAVPRGLAEPIPVTLAVGVQDPPIIGERAGGDIGIAPYDYVVPDLRGAVEGHVAAAATAFGLRPQASARLRLDTQVEPYVHVGGSPAATECTVASVVGTATLSDERGPIFTAPLLGRSRVDGIVAAPSAFVALDIALERWFGALDAKIRTRSEIARRIRAP
jgi:hypothetical protein